MIPVCGLDTSSKGVHAVIYNNGEVLLSHFETKDPSADARRHAIFAYCRDVLCPGLPVGTYVFCEEPLALKNGKTTRLLGLAAGAIWAAHVDHDLTWFWVDVSTWKSAVVGNGNASKAQVQAWVKAQWHYADRLVGGPEDLYDAACLAIYGRRMFPEVKAA